MDSVLLEAEYASYEAAAGAFAESRPDGAIIALDADPPTALQLVGELLGEYPRLAVIVLSARAELLVQAYRLGAKSLLDYPVKAEDLLVALRNLSTGVSLQRPPRGRVLAFMPSRGGVGCTTLAVNLACTLAAEPSNQVVLIDLDFVTGATEVALDLLPEHRLSDLAGHLENIDLLALRNSLIKHNSGVLLLPRPARCQEIALITPDHVQRILGLLRITFSHIVLDLSKGWLPTDVRALELADEVIFVAEPDLGSIRNAVLLLNSLRDINLTDDKIRVVMNRVGGDYGGGSISLENAEEAMGRAIYWQVPNEYKAVIGAWNAGAPLVKVAPRSKVQQSISGLAAALAGSSKAGASAKQTMSTQVSPKTP